jgi:hypothetical protein
MGMEQHITLTDIPITSGDPRNRIARWISNILSPPIFGFLFLVLVGMSQPSIAYQLWILFYMGAVILLPIGYIFWLLKKKQITDFHIKLRQQRYKPMFVMFLCSLFAWGIMRLGSANPWQISACSCSTSVSSEEFIVDPFHICAYPYIVVKILTMLVETGK